MAFCGECGSFISPDTRFCPECGASSLLSSLSVRHVV